MRTKPRKWIAAEIDRLDPYRDYEQIIALSSSYYLTDFLLDYVYAITFPMFLVPLRSSQPVLREGKGKMYKNPNKRMDDTTRHRLIWWEKGPSDPMTQRSVESINKLHEHWAKTYPEQFSFDEDYLLALCYEETMMHRLMVKLGMPGLSEKEQIAAHEFWSRMAALFRNAGTGNPLEYPADFAGSMKFLDDFAVAGWPVNPEGPEVMERVLQPFAERRFPRPLYPLARALVVGLQPDFVLEAHDYPKPGAFTRWLAQSFMKSGLIMSSRILPDPEITLAEKHRQARAQKVAARESFSKMPEPIREAAEVASMS